MVVYQPLQFQNGAQPFGGPGLVAKVRVMSFSSQVTRCDLVEIAWNPHRALLIIDSYFTIFPHFQTSPLCIVCSSLSQLSKNHTFLSKNLTSFYGSTGGQIVCKYFSASCPPSAASIFFQLLVHIRCISRPWLVVESWDGNLAKVWCQVQKL